MAIFNKTFIKFAAGFGVVVVFIILFGLFGENLKNSWERRAENKALDDFYTQVEKEQERMIEAYKNDTYGGATPEETWGMFIAALEKGDTSLAAKYFVVEKQEEMKNELTDILKTPNGAWLDSIQHGTFIKNSSDRAEVHYKSIVTEPIKIEGTQLFIQPGEYQSSSVFIVNQYTNKWKIESL